jgi:hypothetical protein
MARTLAARLGVMSDASLCRMMTTRRDGIATEGGVASFDRTESRSALASSSPHDPAERKSA